MKTGTTRHRKVYALAEILGVRRAEAIGILTAFWELTGEQFPDGDISRAPLTYLAEQCLWHPERGQELLDALIKAELLDQIVDGKLYIHDWHDHCENTVHRKLWRRKMWFANGLPPKFAAMDKTDKLAATKWYSENAQQNSGGIPSENNRIPTETPAVTSALAVAVAVAPAKAKAKAKEETDFPADAGSAAKPKRKARVKKPKPTAEYKQLTDYFVAQWEVKYGTKYPFAVKDGAAAGAIWKHVKRDLSRGKDIIDRFLACEEAFYAGHQLTRLRGDLPKFVSDAGTNAIKLSEPKQKLSDRVPAIMARQKEEENERKRCSGNY